MNPQTLEIILAVNRVLTYGGYVLLAGTLCFWALVWPQGRTDRKLVILAVVGTALLALGTVGGPLAELLVAGRPLQDVTPITGMAILVRLAALTAVAFFLVDLVDADVRGWRRVVALALVGVLAASLVAGSDALVGPGRDVKVLAASGHVLATAAWLGGLVALAVVLVPRDTFDDLDRVIPRFSVVATVSVLILAGTGVASAWAAAGGFRPLLTSSYGLVLGIKVVIFALMLGMGNYGRRYARRVVFRLRHYPAETAGASRVGSHGLAVVMGAEVTIAFVILATTSLLVTVAPHP